MPLIATKDDIMQTLFLLPSHLIIAYSPNEGNLSFLWYITERQPYPLRWNNYTKCRRLISPKRKHFIAEGYSLIAFRSFSLLFTLKLSAKDIAYEASSLNGNEAKDFCLFVSLILFPFYFLFTTPFVRYILLLRWIEEGGIDNEERFREIAASKREGNKLVKEERKGNTIVILTVEK